MTTDNPDKCITITFSFPPDFWRRVKARMKSLGFTNRSLYLQILLRKDLMSAGALTIPVTPGVRIVDPPAAAPGTSLAKVRVPGRPANVSRYPTVLAAAGRKAGSSAAAPLPGAQSAQTHGQPA